VTNIDPAEHFGSYYLETPEQVYNVLRTQVDVVLGDGVAVLNAEDPLAVQMAELCDGEVILFAHDTKLAVVEAHMQQGGRAVVLSNGRLALAYDGQEVLLTKLTALPFLKTAGDDIQKDQQVMALLAAVGAAWALGISSELICAGIETFEVKRSDVG
jgi:cyanophycin synthetase